MLRITWPDGRKDTAASFDTLFTNVRMAQLHRYTEEEFKKELAERTETWTGKRIGWVGSPEEVLRRMADVGAITLEEEDHVRQG